jgi:hypothetical protein
MSSKASNKPLVPVVDGFGGYTRQVDGADNRQQSMIRGTRIKFSIDGEWTNVSTDEVIGPEARFAVTDIERACTKWVGGQPSPETFMLKPGELVPDLAAWNLQCPQSEWREGPDGKQVGPWQLQDLVYMTSMDTMEMFTYVTS